MKKFNFEKLKFWHSFTVDFDENLDEKNSKWEL